MSWKMLKFTAVAPHWSLVLYFLIKITREIRSLLLNVRSPYLTPRIRKVNVKYFPCLLTSYSSSNSNLSCFSVSTCEWIQLHASWAHWRQTTCRDNTPQVPPERWMNLLLVPPETKQIHIQNRTPKFKRKTLNSKMLLWESKKAMKASKECPCHPNPWPTVRKTVNGDLLSVHKEALCDVMGQPEIRTWHQHSGLGQPLQTSVKSLNKWASATTHLQNRTIILHF